MVSLKPLNINEHRKRMQKEWFEEMSRLVTTEDGRIIKRAQWWSELLEIWSEGVANGTIKL
jgi:hypothetical protein